MKSSKACRLVAMLLCCSVLVSAPRAARADWGSILLTAVIVGESLVLLGGLGLAITNGIYAGRNERPPTIALALGYSTAAGNFLAGGLLLSGGLRSRQTWLIAVSSANFGVGGLCLGMTIWGQTRRKKGSRAEVPTTEGLTIAPLILRGTNRSLAPGLGFRYTYR